MRVGWGVVIAGALALAVAHAQEVAAGAAVTSLTGSLTVQRAGQQPRALRLHEPVLPGDTLITDARSEATIQAPDGAAVHVFPDSHVVLRARPAGLQDWLHLVFGSIKVHIERVSGRPNSHRLTTPTAVIAVRGTRFTVLVDDMNATLVTVDEGLVAVANVRSPGAEVLLRPGQRTWVRPDQPPMAAQRFRGRSDKPDLMAERRGRQEERKQDKMEKMETKSKLPDHAQGRGPSHPVPVMRGPVK